MNNNLKEKKSGFTIFTVNLPSIDNSCENFFILRDIMFTRFIIKFCLNCFFFIYIYKQLKSIYSLFHVF